MEKGEPSLIPEWLKSSGSLTGGGTTHHIGSSLLQSDNNFKSKPARSKSSLNASDSNIGRSFVADRNTSYLRRSSSSNSTGQSQPSSTLGRRYRERDWDWEKGICDYGNKEKSSLGDHRHDDCFNPTADILLNNRRSQSMTNGKRCEMMPRKGGPDLSNSNKNNHNCYGLPLRGSAAGSMHNAGFDRDFPSLGVEEKQSTRDIGRVSSPCSSAAIQSLPLGTSAMIGDGWTSVLAEVPTKVGVNGTGGHVQQTASVAPSLMNNSLNMAETLTQGPSRVNTPLQSAGTQKLEELAIKQSRQLIPLIPSVPKTLMSNSSEKAKPKIGQLQQIGSSHLVNPSMRLVPKPDVSKTSSMGKLHVLKPARERNGVSSAANDSLTTNSVSERLNRSLSFTTSAVGSPPPRSPIHNRISGNTECKSTLITLDKRPVSQAQSRHEFFNLVRKKSTASSSANPSPCPADSLLDLDKSGGIEAGTAPVSLRVTEDPSSNTSVSDLPPMENKDQVTGDDNVSDMPRESLEKADNHKISATILSSEEEEAAFLRSLGWEEDNGEEEGLTEEEINAFYRDVSNKHMEQRLFSRIFQGLQPEFLVSLNLHVESIGGGGVSGFKSCDSKSES